jgi:hypothetical protein
MATCMSHDRHAIWLLGWTRAGSKSGPCQETPPLGLTRSARKIASAETNTGTVTIRNNVGHGTCAAISAPPIIGATIDAKAADPRGPADPGTAHRKRKQSRRERGHCELRAEHAHAGEEYQRQQPLFGSHALTDEPHQYAARAERDNDRPVFVLVLFTASVACAAITSLDFIGAGPDLRQR